MTHHTIHGQHCGCHSCAPAGFERPRRPSLRELAQRGETVNACRQWTKRGVPIRHQGCRDLPAWECKGA